MSERVFSMGDYTNCMYDICEIECDGEVYCTVATKDVELIIGVLEENEKLKQQLRELQEFKDNYDRNMELIENSEYVQDFLFGNL